jgi:hypothetical protein
MPRISVVESFPPAIRQMIRNRLYENGFQTYVQLAAELTEKGYPVNKSALHRFAVKLQAEIKKAELDALVASRVQQLEIRKAQK